MYYIFGGEAYYAQGGGHDFIAAFNTYEEAVAECKEILTKDITVDWLHIFCTERNEIVMGTTSQAHGAEDLDIGWERVLRRDLTGYWEV